MRNALESQAHNHDDELKLARSWESELPRTPLPELDSVWNDLAEKSREQLRSATCEAILDVISGNPVPNGEEFARKYLAGLFDSSIPASELRRLMSDFDDLAERARQGTLTTNDARILLLRYQYCG